MSSSATVIQGVLGHRGDRYPVGGRKQAPRSPPLVGRATPPITGGWDHGDQDSRPPSAIARRVVYRGLAAVRPILRIPE